MPKDDIKNKIFTRRAFLLMGFKGILFLIILGRLYYLQIIKAPKFKMLSDSNRIRLSIILPLRGPIYDQNMEEMAANKNYYRVLLDTREKYDLHNVLSKISVLLDFHGEEKEQFINRVMKRKAERGLIMIYEHLSWEQVAKISANTPDLPGILIDVAQIRYYPKANIMSHITGYVSTVSEKEAAASDDPIYKHRDFKIGKNGVEKFYESDLRGKKGLKQLEVNAHGLPVRELSRKDSVAGEPLILTIDSGLQEFAVKKLDDRGSAAVVMDVTNGNILALCSTPGYDPNQFTQGISVEDWKSLLNDDRNPLINRTISEKYPPGSTFKLVVALSILEQKISPADSVFCPGHFSLGNRRFHCWKEGGHGYVNLHTAIKGSCNVYFYHMAQKIGIDNIHKMASKFGLGQKTGINLPNEISGTMPSRAWKKKYFSESWQKGDTMNTCIGQGFMESTPIQLATMTACLANKKYRVVPNLVFDPTDMTPRKFEPLSVSQDHIQRVLNGMSAVTNEIGGTAFGSRIRDKSFRMGGKTGTSQVVARHINEELEDEEILRKNRNHALFVGFAPVHKPRYAIAVVVEHGGSGSRAAAPVARDILLEAQRRQSADMLYNKPIEIPTKESTEAG